MNDPETNDRRSKEEDGSQECESNISLELGALGLSSDTVPVPDAAAVHGTDVVNEESKGNDVEDEEHQIGGPVKEAGGEWEEEDERE